MLALAEPKLLLAFTVLAIVLIVIAVISDDY